MIGMWKEKIDSEQMKKNLQINEGHMALKTKKQEYHRKTSETKAKETTPEAGRDR